MVIHGVLGAHSAPANSDLLDLVDEVSVVVRTIDDVAELQTLLSLGCQVSAIVPLESSNLALVSPLAVALAAAGPDRVVFTWPLHGAPPPPAAEAVRALPPAVDILAEAGVPVGIKGLPACALGSLSSLGWRTANRWYVDADHQLESALLFFPDVVRFAREDECRWCRVQQHCDGAVAQWLKSGLVGPLRAVRELL